MLVFLGFSILSALLLRLYAPASSAAFIEQAHLTCLNACPHSKHVELYQAVVCGGRIQSPSVRAIFAQLGLIHLLVVSGSHFVVLESLLKLTVLKITPHRLRGAFVFSILLLFTLMTKASPPVLRAFFMFCLLAANLAFSLQWTRLQTLTIAGFATLPFCRDRWQLCSLFLSWLAALALEKMSGEKSANESGALNWRQKFLASVFINSRVYFLLIPPLLLLTVPHPLTILANVLFAPVMGLVLFPMSLLVFIFRPLTFVSDWIWNLILRGSEILSHQMPSDYGQAAYPSELLVFYLAAVTLGV
ncbi:hypothetical protein EON76_06990, partial [bacterium]